MTYKGIITYNNILLYKTKTCLTRIQKTYKNLPINGWRVKQNVVRRVDFHSPKNIGLGDMSSAPIRPLTPMVQSGLIGPVSSPQRAHMAVDLYIERSASASAALAVVELSACSLASRAFLWAMHGGKVPHCDQSSSSSRAASN